jgi:hypothetical protein
MYHGDLMKHVMGVENRKPFLPHRALRNGESRRSEAIKIGREK